LFSFSSIEQYHAELNNGSTTCVQAVQHYLSAIEKQKELNAYVEVFETDALDQAAALDALHKSGRKGKLHGVVMGLKDNICYKGHQVSAASGILQNFMAPYSATVVERLLEEGAIIIGRQNCDEFGMGSTNEHSYYGPALNPLNHDFVPGGSSGGSAAAVKAGLCMAALGSDTGGSVRLPADFCGIVGFKPSYGRVSRYGLIAYASSFDQVGILTHSVADAATIFEVISGPDEFDSTVSITKLPTEKPETARPYKIAYFQEWLHHASIDPLIANAVKEKLKELKEAGHVVEPVPFPLTDFIVPAYYILTTAEASSNLSRYDGVRFGTSRAKNISDLVNFYKETRTAGFGTEVKRRIMLGSFVLSTGYFDAYFTTAQKVRQQLLDHTKLIFKEFDFIITPTSPTLAYPVKGELPRDPIAMYMGDIFTVFANLTGIAAVALPLFKGSYNLSFGLQVHCSTQNEVSLLRFTHQMMQQ
jgi:aspartyl-tRNA(Asn)/glutamyl-tRNA(Gln) amidotransferase subunit A